VAKNPLQAENTQLKRENAKLQDAEEAHRLI
jgi:cell division protein FtsB